MTTFLQIAVVVCIVIALYYWIFPRNVNTKDDDDDNLNCGGW